MTKASLTPDIKDKLRIMAKEMAGHAYAPYSKALVGSALLTYSGNYYRGHNIENSSYGATVCAERVAIFQAITQEDTSTTVIEAIYIYTQAGWPPCGLCLQVMAEFSSPDTIIIIGDNHDNETIYSFKQLYPMAFTAEQLQNLK